MHARLNEFEKCDTIFYQGANCSQSQALHYTGNQTIIATTGEIMWCTGRNNLEPLKVIYNLHIGTEILDVNLRPYNNYIDYLNPFKVLYSAAAWAKDYYCGVHIMPPMSPSPDSIVFHTANLSLVSYGQNSDITSHHNKYQSWQEKADKKSGLILWGVSRGTAATFCALAKYHYPEVKLVVLEGAIDSIENIIKNDSLKLLRYENVAKIAEENFHKSISFLQRNGLFGYKRDGESPINFVNDFPQNVPVVFITSEADKVVPPENTENIATALASRGNNDVYLLKLKKSSHPCYMYDDKNDRDTYEAFIHAIYKKYGLQHDAELAEKGKSFIESSLLSKNVTEPKIASLKL